MTGSITLSRAVIAAWMFATTSPVTATDYIVAVPQVMASEAARILHTGIPGFVLETAKPDDVVRVIDAIALETIAVFRIPSGGGAETEDIRRSALAEPLDDWYRFVTEHYERGGEPAAGIEGTVKLPRLLDHLGAEIYADRLRDERKVCILAVGNAQHRDPQEPKFDMVDGRFPADGLLFASRRSSPYGTADRQGNLQGFSVSMFVLDADWEDDMHRERIRRAWKLFIEAQSGVLTSFSADWTMALEHFRTCEREPTNTPAWDATRELEAMITVEEARKIIDDPSLNQAPDEDGEFGKVVRVDEASFGENAGVIRFDEVALRTQNPRYLPQQYGGGADSPVVQFGGYFVGQRLGRANECPVGANLTGCVAGTPSDPLAIDPRSPAVFTAEDRSNPQSPSLSGSPLFNGPVSMLFERDVAAVGLDGGFFNSLKSTAIRAFDREGRFIGGVVNVATGMEFLALATEDGAERIAGIQFSLIGPEADGFGVDNVHFALRHQMKPVK